MSKLVLAQIFIIVKKSLKFASKHFELILHQTINNSFKLDLKIIINRLYFEIIISKQV